MKQNYSSIQISQFSPVPFPPISKIRKNFLINTQILCTYLGGQSGILAFFQPSGNVSQSSNKPNISQPISSQPSGNASQSSEKSDMSQQRRSQPAGNASQSSDKSNTSQQKSSSDSCLSIDQGITKIILSSFLNMENLMFDF